MKAGNKKDSCGLNSAKLSHHIPASDAAPHLRCLRSANRNYLTLPRCEFSTYGCRAFHHASPKTSFRQI